MTAPGYPCPGTTHAGRVAECTGTAPGTGRDGKPKRCAECALEQLRGVSRACGKRYRQTPAYTAFNRARKARLRGGHS